MSDAFLFLGRLLVALMFFWSGWAALSDIQGTAAYFAGLGLPFPTLATIGTGIFEIAAAALLAAGYQTRLAAAALAAFSIVASFLGHFGQGEGAMAFWHTQMLLKDIAVAGGLVAFAVFGAGRWSVDGWLQKGVGTV
ncbi:MAG: DoxX family protein [Rhizobiaceae bacterium]|nr:DoxX family protein [Rhizobiaceae bacterium]